MADVPLARPSLSADLLCIGCGYNLRGLDPAGRCPECGLTIADSTRGDRLQFADPNWLKTLRLGTTLKLWNIAITIFGGMSVGFIASAMGGLGPPFAFFIIITMLGTLLGLWATFCITAQEPRITLIEDPVTLRKVIRTCALIAAIGTVASNVSTAAMTPGTNLSGSQVLWMILGWVVGLAGVVVFMGELKYFQSFALRAPDPKLARSTRILMWILGVGMILAAVGGALIALIWRAMPAGPGSAAIAPPAVGGPPGGGAVTFMAVGACVFSAGALILGLWYISLLTRYRRLFKRALDEGAAAAL